MVNVTASILYKFKENYQLVNLTTAEVSHPFRRKTLQTKGFGTVTVHHGLNEPKHVFRTTVS